MIKKFLKVVPPPPHQRSGNLYVSNKQSYCFGSTTIRDALFFILAIIAFSKNVECQFSKRYGDVQNSNDNPSFEMVTCKSVNENYEYVGVQAYQTSTNVLIRGVLIDVNGDIYNNNFPYINTTLNEYNIHPLKIISLEDNDHYLITGYIVEVNSTTPSPFVILTDDLLNPIIFKKFENINGFFTDVDEIQDGNGFLFCGSKSNGTEFEDTDRKGVIVKTNISFTPIWMRYIEQYYAGTLSPDFDNVQEAIIINNSNAIICGTVSWLSLCNATDFVLSRVYIGKIDLNNGAFIWKKCEFASDFISSRIAINNDESQIVLAFNGYDANTSNLVFYDINGNYLYGKEFEFLPPLVTTTFNENGYSCNPCSLSVHIPFIQNIYYQSNNIDIFISGKFIKLENSTTGNRFEMPFSTIYDASGTQNFINTIIYKSTQRFVSPSGFLNYHFFYNCNVWEPLWSPSNTLHRVGYTDEYVTITSDCSYKTTSPIGYYNDKVWAFVNSINICGAEYININSQGSSIADDIEISNIDFVNLPYVIDLTLLQDNGAIVYPFDCSQ